MRTLTLLRLFVPLFLLNAVYYFNPLQEVLIKGLANSRTFQRFALKTHIHIQDAKKVGTETLESHLDQLHKATQQATAQYSTSAFPPKNKGPPIPPLRGFSGFLAAFAKEVRQDLGLLTK
mmetsp:Transcript_25500/g.36552  ORF Transcript_25500/g.36552 Transcript_25500/m.36552 type:complete len:120 (+) Transcript_25500:306-665(+)